MIKDQLKLAIDILESAKTSLSDERITKAEALEVFCDLILDFCNNETGEQICTYLRRQITREAYCSDCSIPMEEDQIDFAYCKECNDDLGFTYRVNLGDI